MKLNQIDIGDIIMVADWSYSVNPTTLKMDLSYYPYLSEPYEVIKKGRFPGKSVIRDKKVFNNLHIKSVRDGHEYYIKAKFVNKI